MATPPTFTTGQILTSAQMNSVGLWLVKSQTVGSGVSSVTVTGAFSAEYDNYRITYSGGTQSSSTDLAFKLGASATGYFGFLVFGDSTGGGTLGAGTSNNTVMPWIGGGGAGQASHVSLDVMAPFLSIYTKFRNGSYQNGSLFGTLQGEHRVASSYTEFTISVAAGNLTGGTIRVYGYRN